MTQNLSNQPPEDGPEDAAPAKVSFFSELKRRKVLRVAITYAVVAWLIIQVAATTFSGFGIPEWAFRFVVIMLILGLPIAMIITWAFELTPDGVKLSRQVTPDERADSSQSKRNRLAFTFAAGLPTLIFGTLAAFFYFTRGVPDVDAGPSDKSIAVLPFRNVSADSNNAYFCDGVQEDILTTLANIGDMQVISRTSVMRYKDSDKAIPEIGLELGVSYILEGSVQRSGSRVRVTGQLINAKTDEHLWAKSYDRDLTDIFAIQGEISREIAQSLQAILTPDEAALIDKQVSVHPAAYDLVLKGRSLARSTEISQKELFQRCEVLFQAATEMDPDYVDAWVELAYNHVWSYFNFSDPTDERLKKAKDAIDRAMELDPKSSQVLIGLGNYYYYGHKDYEQARIQYEKALLRSTNNADALASLGYISRREGKWKDTLRYFEDSFRLDPNNITLLNNYHEFALQIRRFDDAIRLGRHMAEIAPELRFMDLRILIDQYLKDGNYQRILDYFDAFPMDKILEDDFLRRGKLYSLVGTGKAEEFVRFFDKVFPNNQLDEKEAFLNRYYGIALERVGRHEEAVKIIEILRQRSSNSLKETPNNEFIMMDHARICALLGDREEAFDIVDQLLSSAEKSDQLRYLQVLNLKLVCLINLDDEEAAFDLLEKLIQMPYGPNVFTLKSHMDFYPIQDNPRTLQLIADPRNNEPLF